MKTIENPRSSRWAIGLTINLAIGALLLVTPSLSAQETFSDSTSVVVVEVPVHVVADGKPVRGLTAANFEVTDGRKKRELIDFEVIDLQEMTFSEDQSVTDMAPVARRHFMILFDLSFSDPTTIVRAREAAETLVLGGLHESDLVAVATYSASQGPRMVLNFTSDRRQIDLAIETLGANKLFKRAPDPLNIVLGDLNPISGADGPGGDASGAGAEGPGGVTGDLDSQVRDHLQAIAGLQGQAERTDQANKVIALTRALGEFAKQMAGVEGRKHVVYLSEGFESSLIMGTTDVGEIERMNQASILGSTQEVDSDQRFGNMRTLDSVNDMLEEFRRADITIQAVNIAGLRAGADQRPRADGDGALFYLANETGGEMYRNYNDLGDAMGQMLERTGVTYLLAFQPQDLKFDGSYRRLKVKLKNVPRGTRVVHRPGYYAPKPSDQRSGFERQLDIAEQILGGAESGSIKTSILAAPFKVTNERAYVPVLVEVDGASFLAGGEGQDRTGVEFYAYALDANGGVQDFFTESVGLDLTQVGETIRNSGVKFFGHLNLAPGRYNLRVYVRNAATGEHSLSVVPTVVPQYGTIDPVILSPFFAEAPGSWLVTREAPAKAAKDVSFPFMLREGPYLPAAMPNLRKGDSMPVALVAYNLGTGELKLDVVVEAADGTAVDGGTMAISDRFRLEGEDADRLVGTFKVDSLEPGDYTLNVTVGDGETGATDTGRTPFRVVG